MKRKGGETKNTDHFYHNSAASEEANDEQDGLDLKDRMELPKPDMRVAILDIQHELTVEGIERKKTDYTEDELKHLPVTRIAKHYPTPEWAHMYIDGSATPGEGNAGAGVYSDIFQQAWPAGRNGSNYDGEIKAISEALVKIKELQIPKTLILSDSKAAIQAIVSKEEKDPETLECKRLLVWLHNRNKHVTLQWVPAHCNIYGNDEADNLAKAKEGSKMKQYKKALSYNAVKSHVCTAIKSNIKKTWEKAIKCKQWLEAVIKKR
jgi:ribonuclease HI